MAEKRYLHKDGHVVWGAHSTALVWGPDGVPLHVISQVQDITRRKQTEEVLRGQAELLNLAHDAIIVHDPQSLITFWNRGAEHLYGWSVAEALGRVPHELLRTQFPVSPADVDACLEQQGFWSGDLVHTTRDGRQIVVESHQALRRDADGRPVAILEINADITERKQVEEALRRANANLEKANQAKSEFLATMSHEIRTPLNGVIGLTSLLLGTPLTPEQQEYVTGIRSSGAALLSLINDILDLSKIEAGHLTLEVQPFDLRQVVHEVVDIFAMQVRAKGLQISAQVDRAVPPLLEGDPVRLRQILTNLIGNAVKFTAHGAVEARVDLVAESPQGALLRVSVHDTGIGIGPATRATLFEPFTQADASTTRRYGGTGLGLAIAKRLVAAMDGQIGVESTLGQGSTFWVTLHLAKGAAPRGVSAAPVQGVPFAPAARRAGSTARGRVLVAEDNAINQLVAARLLESLGYAVDTVANGQRAVEAVHQGHYDLVLVDCHMPQMDVFAATAAIRRDEAGRGQHTPIVALAADALVGDAEKSLAAGMDDYLAKPITPERLAAVVGRCIAGSAAAASISSS